MTSLIDNLDDGFAGASLQYDQSLEGSLHMIEDFGVNRLPGASNSGRRLVSLKLTDYQMDKRLPPPP
jgi:hypothetical protein